MTDSKDDGTDRRSLLVGAAVGAAASLAAGSASAQTGVAKPGGTRVVVDLGGVKLPEDVARQLGDSVRRTVLEVLAGYDSRQSMVVLPHVKVPEWNGIWIRWSDNFQLPESTFRE